jgi:glycosyltransferase involved in cell wall biosynthesis
VSTAADIRVWHVNASGSRSPVDGITSAVRRLHEAQASLGCDVRVFSSDGQASVRQLVRTVGRLLAAGDRPDIVHFHSVFRPAHAVIARRLRRLGIPYVVSPHAGLAGPALHRDGLKKEIYGHLVELGFVRGAAGVACLTEVERRAVARYADPYHGHLAVVSNSLDPEMLRARLWSPAASGRPVVVTLARYDVRQKGLDYLAELAHHCPDLDFVVHGAQDKNEPHMTRRLLAAAPANFHLRPPVFGADKLAALAAATLFAQPSRWEGLSISLMEAMAVGVPCAVSEYVAGTLPFAEGRLGLVFDPDVARAAGQLHQALDLPARLRAWSIAAFSYARGAFDPRSVALVQLRHYEAVLGRAVDDMPRMRDRLVSQLRRESSTVRPAAVSRRRAHRRSG